MARRRRGLLVNGIVLLDKPKGLSSNHALQRVRRLFEAQKRVTPVPWTLWRRAYCLFAWGGYQVFIAPAGS